MSWVRIRNPAFGIRADVTSWTGGLILNFAGRRIARVESLAKEIDAGSFAEGSGFGELRCAGCNGLCCRSDGDRSASVAAYQSGDGVDRENGWGRWAFTDLGVLDDVECLDLDGFKPRAHEGSKREKGKEEHEHRDLRARA